MTRLRLLQKPKGLKVTYKINMQALQQRQLGFQCRQVSQLFPGQVKMFSICENHLAGVQLWMSGSPPELAHVGGTPVWWWVVPMRCQPTKATWRNWNSSLIALRLAARFWVGFCLLPPPPPPPSILIPFHCFYPSVVFDPLLSLLVSSLRTCSCRRRKTEWNIRLHVTMIKRHVRKPRLSF